MNGPGHMNLPGRGTGREPHTLAGAYAMDALDEGDRVRFEQHLAGCDACTQEIAGLLETTARLGAATATPPPAALKEKVLAAARQTRQHTPAVTQLRPRRYLRVVIPAAAAAALIVIAVVFGMVNSTDSQRLGQAQQSSTAIAAIMTAEDATMMQGQVSGGGSATVVMSHAEQALVFMARGLPALPAARTYELWLIGPAGDRPAGLLPPLAHGMSGPVIARGLRPGDHLMLTVEPVQGTEQPTTRMMLDITL
jgi:anti-sigma-K factor RskA